MSESQNLTLTPELITFMDDRIKAAMIDTVKTVKLWAISAVFGMFVMIAGSTGVIIFKLGEMSSRFDAVIQDDAEQTRRINSVVAWAGRKDIIDSSVTNHLSKDGSYLAPRWYNGRDAEELGVK
jgi:hypothetical protein